MALKQTLFLFSLLSSMSFLVCSRTLLPSSFKTSTLNVTASLHMAVNFSPVTDQPEDVIESPNLILNLHSRDSFHDSPHKDYKTRVLARLARDSARVNSLQTRQNLAVSKTTPPPNLQPLKSKTHDTTNGYNSPVASGTSQGSGEYFTRLGIGHPPRQLYVVIDTGSDVSWVQCEPCSVCYSQSDPVFDPIRSSSFMSLPCASPKCRALDVSECNIGRCLYEVSYGDGSYTVGEFATETISFRGGATVESVAIGCGHTNEGLFIGAGGLLGLGGGTLSFPSQINATSFSYCLVDRDSTSQSILEFNSEVDSLSHVSGVPISAPLVKNPQLDTFYYVGMTGISVGGESLPVSATSFEVDGEGNGGVIIDSGTAVTRLEESVYEALRDEFRGGAAHLPVAEGVAIFDTCYDLRGQASVAVPAVELEFAGGKRLQLPAKNYMIPVDSEGTFCLAFARTTSSMSIIGNVQQQGIRVGFDLVNSVVNFHVNRC